MKINNLKINSFGNLNNKEIELSEKINIIKGNNESGKSTLLKFIIDIFYGISKNKRGKEFSDYDRYKPWLGEEFSGKLTYTLDDGKKFEVYRDFNKKNPKIYNENSEEISKQFNIDKTSGNQFFFEQTKIDETLFLSTLISEQEEVKLDKQTQNILIQKVANLAGTGDDKISYKKAMDKLNKKQVDEIGTERTQERPINIINEKIKQTENEINEINNFKEKKYEIETLKNNLEKEIEKNEKKLKIISEIKKIKEQENIENEKIKLNEKIKINNEEKIKELKTEKEKIKKIENNNSNKNKKNNIIFSLIILFLILIIAINIFIIKNPIIYYIFIPLVILAFTIFIILNIFSKNKIKNKEKIEKQNIEQKENEINTEINLLEKNNKIQNDEIEKIKNKINLEINLKKEKLKNNNIEENEINYYFNLQNINIEFENIQNKLNKNKLEYHTLELDKNNIEPKVEQLSSLEEQLEELKEEKENLLKLNESIEIAKQALETAYQKMKENVTPKFTENLSKNIEKISDGKYKNVRINDEEGIIVEKENGEYISAEKLSVGTIQQLYISLRLAMAKEISEENMPIILDEAFAYYDTERLKNILKYLNTEFQENQIIILTCTDREKEILEKENIPYKLTIM